MKIITIFTLCLLALSNTLLAQTNIGSKYTEKAEKANEEIIVARLYINEFPSKKEQFYDNWNLGSIEFTNGKQATNCQLRYNKWKDELIWLRPSDFKSGAVIKGNVKSFSYINSAGETIKFIHYINNKGILKQDIYLQELNNGYASLYCHRKSSYIKSSNLFSDKYQYIICINGEMQNINLSKHKILSFFSDEDQKTIKVLAKENYLKFKKDNDIAKILDLYNKQRNK